MGTSPACHVQMAEPLWLMGDGLRTPTPRGLEDARGSRWGPCAPVSTALVPVPSAGQHTWGQCRGVMQWHGQKVALHKSLGGWLRQIGQHLGLVHSIQQVFSIHGQCV